MFLSPQANAIAPAERVPLWSCFALQPKPYRRECGIATDTTHHLFRYPTHGKTGSDLRLRQLQTPQVTERSQSATQPTTTHPCVRRWVRYLPYLRQLRQGRASHAKGALFLAAHEYRLTQWCGVSWAPHA